MIRLANSKAEVDSALEDARVRTPNLTVNNDSAEFFRDPSIHVLDATKALIFSFSKRENFITFSFGSSDTAPNLLEMETIMSTGLNEMIRIYGRSPGGNNFSGLLTDRCPWIKLFLTQRDDTIIDTIYLAGQSIITPLFNVPIIRLAVPRQTVFGSPRGYATDVGILYAHTDPILIDSNFYP